MMFPDDGDAASVEALTQLPGSSRTVMPMGVLVVVVFCFFGVDVSVDIDVDVSGGACGAVGGFLCADLRKPTRRLRKGKKLIQTNRQTGMQRYLSAGVCFLFCPLEFFDCPSILDVKLSLREVPRCLVCRS